VSQIAVDRRWIAHEADALAGQGCGVNETLNTKANGHHAIIRAACGGGSLAARRVDGTPCAKHRSLIDYATLVVSPACFACVKSRSSLPDSLSLAT